MKTPKMALDALSRLFIAAMTNEAISKASGEKAKEVISMDTITICMLLEITPEEFTEHVNKMRKELEENGDGNKKD